MTDQLTIKYKNNITKGDGSITCNNKILGKDFVALVASSIGVNPSEIRVLLQGKYLKEDLTLADQKLTNNSRVLLMKGTSEDKKLEIQHKAEKEEKTQRIIKAAEKVATRVDGGESGYDQQYFEVQNQHGAQMNLDPEDRKSLVKGMTLHEKGQKMISGPDTDVGLKFLLEADAAFQSVKDPSLINSIDNYALLCLDINWAMLKKKDFVELNKNSWRLDKSHEILKKAYGENNERLIQLKGGCCPELVNYVRLYLLQAIHAYNVGELGKAKHLVQVSEEKLTQMTITDEDVLPLLQMGFTMQESRIGLRAVNKNKNDAIMWVLSRREKKEEAKRQERQKRKDTQRQKKFGKTSKGNLVDLKLLDALVTLGYSEELVAEALKQADNQQDSALNLLMNESYLLNVALEKNKPKYVPTEEDIQNLTVMGFTIAQARGTLKKTGGNLQQAVDLLLAGNGVEDSEATNTSSSSSSTPTPPTPAAQPNTEQQPQQDSQSQAEKDEELAKKVREEELLNAAEEELVGTHTEDDDVSHLAIDLTEEHELLAHYKALILSSQ